MRILIGMDDSPCSQAAMEYVCGMSWPKGTKVTVLSAMRPVVTGYIEAYVPTPEVTARIEQEQCERFEALLARAERALRASGLDARARTVRGDPREALLDAARAEHSDLIVLGSHGRSGFSKLLLGSVAGRIVTHAPCTVTVVKAAPVSNPPAAAAQARGQGAAT